MGGSGHPYSQGASCPCRAHHARVVCAARRAMVYGCYPRDQRRAARRAARYGYYPPRDQRQATRRAASYGCHPRETRGRRQRSPWRVLLVFHALDDTMQRLPVVAHVVEEFPRLRLEVLPAAHDVPVHQHRDVVGKRLKQQSEIKWELLLYAGESGGYWGEFGLKQNITFF